MIRNWSLIQIVLLVLIVLFALGNGWQTIKIMEQPSVQSLKGKSLSVGGNPELAAQILPKGVPKIYGEELKVSFDDVKIGDPVKADLTIKKMGAQDDLALSGESLTRYIKIASQISCEYCCTAQAIIFSDGKAACGCAHSAAMRGLAKYLINRHGPEFSDDQILEELGKWKTLFFPANILAKAVVLKEKNIELNYINLTSNKYRGIEKGSAGSGGMVGGC